MDRGTTRTPFPSTNLLRVERARDGGEGLNEFLSVYWRAIYAFIRRCGHDPAEAADLAQGFVLTKIVEGDLLTTFDASKGSLRAYIRRALEWYLKNEHRHANAKRRMPEGMVGMDLSELRLADPQQTETPEEAFDRRLEADRLEKALERVREECVRDGIGLHWVLFEEWVIKRELGESEVKDLTMLAAKHGVVNAETASSMIRTVKRRVVQAMR